MRQLQAPAGLAAGQRLSAARPPGRGDMTASPGRRRVAGKADGVADGPVHARQPTRAEEARTRRRGLAEPPRATLFRLAIEAAADAGTEQEFFDRMAAAGVRVRLIHDIAGAVTEYAAGLRGDVTLDGGQAWHGGRQLAPGLSLPRLRRQWTRRQQGRRIPPARRRGELRDAGAHVPGTPDHAAPGRPTLPPCRAHWRFAGRGHPAGNWRHPAWAGLAREPEAHEGLGLPRVRCRGEPAGRCRRNGRRFEKLDTGILPVPHASHAPAPGTVRTSPSATGLPPQGRGAGPRQPA
jgi:hypothetical protein